MTVAITDVADTTTPSTAHAGRSISASTLRVFWELRVQRALGSTRPSSVRVADNDPVIPSR